MKFLLVVYMFVLDPNGNIQSNEVLTQPFFTLEDCNYAGRNLRELTGTNTPEYAAVKTLSYCVGPDDYKEKVS